MTHPYRALRGLVRICCATTLAGGFPPLSHLIRCPDAANDVARRARPGAPWHA